jgi:hypothetical protein
MDLSQLKTQVMTMFMMKSAQQPRFLSSGGNQTAITTQPNPYGEIWSILYGMMVMNMVEYGFKHLPALLLVIQAWVFARWKPKQKDWLPALGTGKSDEKEKIHSVTMTRVFQKQTSDRETNVNVEKVDAVLDFICALDNARHVRLDTRYTIGTTEDIPLTPDLKARVKHTTGGATSTGTGEEISTFEIILFSSVLKLTDIRAWIDDVHKNYVFEKNNKLGNNIYYFNEIPHEPAVLADMSGDKPKQTYRWDNMPKTLTFNMNEFKTSKSFTNVYGNHVDELKERLDLFVNHPEWYAERGIPHSLGIMLHGIPGAGKTSTIKAIAKDTNRHIFNLSLRPFTTQKQLLNLFYNEAVVVNKYDGTKTTYNIPMNRRVYVIEDIDCMTDVTMDRSLAAASDDSSKTTSTTSSGDAVTLSFLLNLLDGVLETPGRILVITSNYPEKLDKALVRPGRIDVKIEFKNASREFIREMVSRFYSESVLSIETIPSELDNVFTPAEVMESLCTHFKSKDAALKHLMSKRARQYRQEPCLVVQELPPLPLLPPSRVDSAMSMLPIAELEKENEDKGTSLESLGISTQPKNELVQWSDVRKVEQIPNDVPVSLSNYQPKPLSDMELMLNSMSYNAQLAPPKEMFHGGMIPNEELIRTTQIVNSEQIEQYMIHNPEFIPDVSGIHGFDMAAANPSSWSDAREITNPILDEESASKVHFNPPDRADI